MFGDISKLFDRNFAVGFFLPVFVWFSASLLLIHQYIYRFDLSGFEQIDYLVWTTVFGMACLIGGIVFLAANRGLYRFMEGYGLNPLKWFKGFEIRRYRAIWRKLEDLENEYQSCAKSGQAFPVESSRKRDELVSRLAVEFPEQEELLLPTPFGNALRSFESFPRVMYGLDSIPAWGRLLAVVPKEYFELIDGAKAYVDLWVNLGVVFIFLQIEYVGLVFATGQTLNWWVVGLLYVLATIAPVWATSSALEWGELVKAAFDVFIPKLREALEIERPKNRQEEFDQWQNFSRALIYRYRDDLPELKMDKENKQSS
ncbi:MAG: hypothetical protein ACOYZ6_05785 [Chloroflexota bacterium]